MTGPDAIRKVDRSAVSVIIPCLDEETAIGPCVAAVRAHGVGEVIVVDGGSGDRTVERASEAGARIVVERRRGYGRAMLAGIAALSPRAEVVLFIDGDGSDRPEMIPAMLVPIACGAADFVMGSRLKGPREPGSLAPAQILAGHFAGILLRLRYGVRFTDMSPFRAIRRDALERLGMRDETFGWALEMQMRAAAAGLRIVEVPVGQRRRAGGVSKVSGDLKTAARATLALVKTFLRLAISMPGKTPRHPYTFYYARRLVRDARRNAGLPEHVTLAACRHGGMTELGDAEITQQGVMSLSGHRTPEAARLYVKRTEAQRAIAARRRRAWVASGAETGTKEAQESKCVSTPEAPDDWREGPSV